MNTRKGTVMTVIASAMLLCAHSGLVKTVYHLLPAWMISSLSSIQFQARIRAAGSLKKLGYE